MDYFAKGVGSNKQKGTAGELLFHYEAYRRGLFPCKPDGDPPCFDTIIVNRKTGKPMVVQTRTPDLHGDARRGTRYHTKALCNSDTLHIRYTNVDVLAVYCTPLVWYFIPVKKIVADNVSLYPQTAGSRGQYEKFKEKWGVFGFSKDDLVLLS